MEIFLALTVIMIGLVVAGLIGMGTIGINIVIKSMSKTPNNFGTYTIMFIVAIIFLIICTA